MRIGINGFGRMGRLSFRAAWDWPEFDIVHINEIAGGPETAAHLLEFDTVHGRWDQDIQPESDAIWVDGKRVSFSTYPSPQDVVWKAPEVVFAVNSSLHSYLILAYSDADQVTLDVGFYYMANAAGRLVGTLLSGSMYLLAGLPGCVWTSAGLVLAAAGLTLFLPAKQEDRILTLHFQRSSEC